MAAPVPFGLRDGQLVLEEVLLADLAAEREGRAAWVFSRGSLEALLLPPRTVAVGRIGPPAVLARLASADWWARVRSAHELQLALAAGFPPERVVVSGRVKDDGSLKDALVAGVGVLESRDEEEAQNVDRIARGLGCAVPAERGAPPEAEAGRWDRCGGLLAPVLRGPPALALDAPWPGAAPGEGAVAVWPLRPGVSVAGTVEGLSHATDDLPAAAAIHGPAARGEWVLLPSAWAMRLRPPDPCHAPPPTILVSGNRWRILEERGAPAPDP